MLAGSSASGSQDAPRAREFVMSDEDFAFIQKLALEKTGIVLGIHKREMVYSRIVRRLRALNIPSFGAYCRLLEQDQLNEIGNFVNAITTNLTSFFRENHHFEFLSSTVFSEIRSRQRGDKRVRIWSAGCSTGEEPYSLAITVKEARLDSAMDVKILATDLDSNVVEHGRRGVYLKDRAASVSPELIKRYFVDEIDGPEHRLNARDDLKSLVQFNRLNLLERWPISGKFDVIFCRNVVIYFSKETQKVLFDRFANHMHDNAYLFIGHSENLHGVTDRFKSLGRTVYQKVY